MTESKQSINAFRTVMVVVCLLASIAAFAGMVTVYRLESDGISHKVEELTDQTHQIQAKLREMDKTLSTLADTRQCAPGEAAPNPKAEHSGEDSPQTDKQ